MKEVDLVQEFLDAEDSIFIAKREIIEELIYELKEDGIDIQNIEELDEQLEYLEILSLVKCDTEVFVCDPFTEDDELDVTNSEKFIIQDGCLFEDEYDDLKYDELIIFEIEEEDSNSDSDDGDIEEMNEAKLDFIQDYLDDYGVINLVTTYDLAKLIIEDYVYDDFKNYVGIDLQSDVEGYLVTIDENSIFCIEPIKRQGKYFTIDCLDEDDKIGELIIDEDMEDLLDDEFYDFVNASEINVLEVVEETED